jgi:hypothetical protein
MTGASVQKVLTVHSSTDRHSVVNVYMCTVRHPAKHAALYCISLIMRRSLRSTKIANNIEWLTTL